MSTIPLPRLPRRQAKGLSSWEEMSAYGSEVDRTLVDIVNSLSSAGRLLQKVTSHSMVSPGTATLANGDYGDVTVSSAGSVITIDNGVVTYAKMQDVSVTDRLLGRQTAGSGDVEEITCTAFARTILDDTTAAGVLATLGIGGFDATVPADLASAAAAGTSNVIAQRDHVHRFPTSLKEYTLNRLLTMSASGATQILTPDVATLIFNAPTTTIRSNATNTCALGAAAQRWSGVNTVLLNASGIATLSAGATLSGGTLLFSGGFSGFNGDFSPVADNSMSIGDPTHRLAGLYTLTLVLTDQSGVADKNVNLQCLSSPNLSADVALTFNIADSSRVVNITGDTTLADWFDQSVKIASSPVFVQVQLNDTASAFTTVLAATSTGTPASNLVLTLDLVNAAKTIKLTGSPTLDNWFDQSVKVAASPTFAGLTLTADLSVQGNTTIGNATTDTVRFNAGGNASAPTTNAIGVILDYYGTSATRVLTTPNRWWSIIGDDGSTYRIPLYS